MEKLGIGYETLKGINPKIVYAAISGFGQTGPYSQRPAYDVIIQGMGGIMSITGPKDGEPVRVGPSIGDITAGMLGAAGILAALIDAGITGEGRMVDVAMLDGQLAILESAISRYTITGAVPKPMGSRHPSIAPFEAYRASDGYLILACGNDALWQKFCTLVGRTDLLKMDCFSNNAKRVQNAEEMAKHINSIFSEKAAGEWRDLLIKNGIPCSSINTIDKLFSDPQVEARKMLVEVEQPGAGKLKLAGNPIKLSSMESEIPDSPAPFVGQHTAQILREYLGIEAKELEELAEGAVIECRESP
jgi:CoA:oxalate CoA-transferase